MSVLLDDQPDDDRDVYDRWREQQDRDVEQSEWEAEVRVDELRRRGE